MIQRRHPDIAATIVRAFRVHWREQLRFVRIWWMQGLLPRLGKILREGSALMRLLMMTISQPRNTGGSSWRSVNARFIEGTVKPRLTDTARAQMRSQSGPMASVPFVARHTTFDPVLRLLFLRRRGSSPSSSRVCRCGRPLDSTTTTQHVLWGSHQRCDPQSHSPGERTSLP